MKELYYQFVAFIQEMNGMWYGLIWGGLVFVEFYLFLKFWKKADTEKGVFKRPALLVPIFVILLIIIYLTYIRK